MCKYFLFDYLDVRKLPEESEIRSGEFREYVYRDSKYVYSFKILNEKHFYSFSYPLIDWDEFLKKHGKVVLKKEVLPNRFLVVLEFLEI
jgi:hypothetical protein